MNQGLGNAEGFDQPVGRTDGGAGIDGQCSTNTTVTGLEDSWLEAIANCGSIRESPSDPCWVYLQHKGIAMDGGDDKPMLTSECVPLKGQRWYMSLVISGVRGEFLVDTGASHTLIDRKFISRLGIQSDAPLLGVKARTATGDAMQTYGRTVRAMLVEGKTYWICPTIADITDDGILGMDFAALYGVTLTASTGRMQIRSPYKQTIQCVLRGGISVSSVAQSTKLAPGHISNVLVNCAGLQDQRPGMFEPRESRLSELGLESFHTYLANARWGVIPVCNPGSEVITLL